MAVDLVAGAVSRLSTQMRDQLVAEEIETEPVVRTAPLGTTEQVAVEGARLRQVADGEGEVEGAQCHDGFISLAERRA